MVRRPKGRRLLAMIAMLVLGAELVACNTTHGGGSGDGGDALGSGSGFVDRRASQARAREYLRFATEELDPTSPVNVLAHLARAETDRSFDFDPASIGPDDFAATFAKIDAHRDTSDFDLMALIALWYDQRSTITPELREAIEARLLGFRYWFTDPRPVGPDGQELVDDKWFWSENHRIIFHGLEYLAGRALPDATFDITGMTGAEHEARGRERVEAWLDEKARWGFSEWHSDVYYNEDVQILVLLAEHAEVRLARRAAAMLDVLLYDLALHQRAGNVGVTHGRSYMKDKSRALDQDVFGTVKLLFDTTDAPYPSRRDAAATFLAVADRYRLPEVIRRVARSGREIVDREHMGAPLDLDEPFSTDPVSAVPEASYTDPEAIEFWWDRGALTAWQLVPQTLATIEQHDLWETSLFQPYRALADAAGGDPEVARNLAYQLRCMINIGVLSEVDTVTYRSADAMLSSAQDYRPGCFGFQYHAWQATLDEDAVVFTTHPGNEPRPGTDGWVDGDLYWTGSASMPRSAQQGAAAIHLYAPQFVSPSGPPLDSFSYLPSTHAYFPTERFDEVRQVGNWTIGRKGEGYVALWSWRPVQWRDHDPSVVFTNGLTEPFDLVAAGGADNVWIVEVGDAGRSGSFDEFVGAVADAPISVTDLGAVDGVSQGFEVTYESPSEGTLGYSWSGPLTVDGEEVPQHGDQRFDNPYSQTELGDTTISIRDGRARLTLDLADGSRRTRRR